MRKLYVKLAAVNIRNNRQLYLPYLLAGVFSAAMFYLVQSIQDNPGLDQMRGGANVAVTLLLGVIIVGLFAAIFLFYTNSFIMKRRKRELSVYNILGMEKKHIAKVLFLEMLFTAAVTIGGGLAFGIVFGKLMTMLLYRMTGFNQSVPFTISLTGCHHTLVLFGCIYAVTLFYNFMQIKLSNPMELLHSANAGEREPKTKVLLAVIGAAALGGGYYLALTVADAVSAITMFFVAVLLVILGTYCLFTAGSIAVLKLLRKNKNYYYKSRHFTTVSGMIYRMKQNAVGLANICILSTMVLVTVSTTLCMYLGVEDALKRRFAHEVSVVFYYNAMPEYPEEVDALAEASLKDSGRVLTGHSAMLNMSLTAVRTDDGFSVTGIGAGTDYSINDVVLLTILPKSDWENYTGETVGELERGEIALASSSSYEKGTLALDNEIYQVKQICAYPEAERDYLDDMADDSVFMIVPDRETLGQIFTELKQNWDEERVSLQIKYNMAFDIDGTAEEKVAAENALGENAVYNGATNPSCVYTDPEFAGVGLTEEKAKELGIAYQVGKFPLMANGKSLIMNGGVGSIKFIIGTEYKEVLGVHILGPRATDLIGECALAIGMEATVEDIIAAIHAHPTVTEAVREAALAAEKRAIHIPNK